MHLAASFSSYPVESHTVAASPFEVLLSCEASVKANGGEFWIESFLSKVHLKHCVSCVTTNRDMLRRKPTRLELKAEDKEEFDEARKQAAAAVASANATTNRPSSSSVVSTLLSDRPKLSTAQRIGLSK
ncbi:hypothetical protein O6H91_19G021000 [Diphasiastrum complanatum]|uniref:Uncharacterized protein n=1 Tax=Diphasiastrum complanatum TaxID=34168 RepID=A0ACC2AT92_DIPCM|nr:hypothetical protein O6H91_19G021000 [Diphasiastrum complanatum]